MLLLTGIQFIKQNLIRKFFLKPLKWLGVETGRCVVFEDALAGLKLH